MGRRYENKEGKIMNCFMCKGNIEKKKVNYVVDLEDTIIIIKGVPHTICNILLFILYHFPLNFQPIHIFLDFSNLTQNLSSPVVPLL